AREEALAGEVDRDERRRAGGVDRQARAARAEEVGEAAGDEAGVDAGKVVGVDARREVVADVGVVVREDAGDDRGRRPLERLGREPRILERLPRDLEEEALLRVDLRGLARRDLEELGVEAVDLVEEA